jgi:hypothetical protein
MALPTPSLNSVKGVLILILAVAAANALLGTGVGKTLQGTLDGLTAKLPI